MIQTFRENKHKARDGDGNIVGRWDQECFGNGILWSWKRRSISADDIQNNAAKDTQECKIGNECTQDTHKKCANEEENSIHRRRAWVKKDATKNTLLNL